MAAEKLNATDYLDRLRESAKIIAGVRASKEPINDKQLAELYSIYYNTYAGALRAGNMFEKIMDTDGYTKFLIRAGEERYYCKDAPLRDILLGDYDRVTKFPYEDTSESYVGAYKLNAVYTAPEDDQPLTLATGGNAQRKMSPEEEEKMKKRILQAEKKKNEELLKERQRQLVRDARGFDYDPNYDHYYNDWLPEVQTELNSSAPYVAAKIIGALVSALGVLGALVLV